MVCLTVGGGKEKTGLVEDVAERRIRLGKSRGRQACNILQNRFGSIARWRYVELPLQL